MHIIVYINAKSTIKGISLMLINCNNFVAVLIFKW